MRIVALVLGLALALAPSISAESWSLEDVAWIAGDWVAAEGETFMQETWSTPVAGNMLGSFRMATGEKVSFYEIMVIEQQETGPVLRIKHFSPGLIGWEEKEESMVFALAEVSAGRAVWTMQRSGEEERLIYERTADGGLLVTLEKPSKASRTEFRMHAAR